MPAPTNNFVALSPEIERRRLLPVPQAAEFCSISEDNFRKRYAHLIRQVTPRRQGVEVGGLLDELAMLKAPDR